jgi:hypothetical protein
VEGGGEMRAGVLGGVWVSRTLAVGEADASEVEGPALATRHGAGLLEESGGPVLEGGRTGGSTAGADREAWPDDTEWSAGPKRLPRRSTDFLASTASRPPRSAARRTP